MSQEAAEAWSSEHGAWSPVQSGSSDFPLGGAAVTLRSFSKLWKHMNFVDRGGNCPSVSSCPIWRNACGPLPDLKQVMKDVRCQGCLQASTQSELWALIRFNIFKWVFCRPYLHFQYEKAAGAPTAAEVSGLHRFCRGKFSHSCCKHHHAYLPGLILTQIINKKWITQIWKLFRTILVFVWS